MFRIKGTEGFMSFLKRYVVCNNVRPAFHLQKVENTEIALKPSEHKFEYFSFVIFIRRAR